MKNTKFRRRALLSSVAMLLVALVALGSATFAWFTQNTSATASGINVQTAQASNLQISKNDLNWGTSVNYAKTGTFEPASSADGTNWFTAEAGARNNFAKKSDTNFVPLTTNKSSYVFEESLNVKNAGAADVTNVKISFGLGETNVNTGKYYVRVALVPMTPTTAPTTAAQMAALYPTATDFRANVYDVQGAAYNAVSSATAASTEITPTAVTSNVDVDVAASLAQNEIKYFKLYVWFEGQDEDCYADNAGNALPSIQFSVTGTTSNS